MNTQNDLKKGFYFIRAQEAAFAQSVDAICIGDDNKPCRLSVPVKELIARLGVHAFSDSEQKMLASQFVYHGAPESWSLNLPGSYKVTKRNEQTGQLTLEHIDTLQLTEISGETFPGRTSISWVNWAPGWTEAKPTGCTSMSALPKGQMRNLVNEFFWNSLAELLVQKHSDKAEIR